MSTLVYFASGYYKQLYQELPFDQVVLVDKCFMSRGRNTCRNKISHRGKVTLLEMGCLESVNHLKQNNDSIDCFVSINEGLNEGGGEYTINSGFFIGYAMQILKPNYIHIMSEEYYRSCQKGDKRWSDLPYDKHEILSSDYRYINPTLFSSHGENAKVLLMNRISNVNEITLENKLRLKILHESIWNYYDFLDKLVISIKEQGQKGFFGNIPKVIDILKTNIDDILKVCVLEKVNSIGFTPWANNNYDKFIETILQSDLEFPKEILLFHLHADDFSSIKTKFFEAQ